MYNIKVTFSSVNHPHSHELLERFHATLAEMIRVHLAGNLTLCRDMLQLHKTHGFIPNELVIGHIFDHNYC